MAKDIKRILFNERKAGERCVFTDGKSENWNIEKGQWDRFLELGSQVYSAYLQYHYFVSEKPLTSEREIQAVNWFGNDTINLFTEILSKRKELILTTEEITALGLDLADTDLISKKLKPETVSSLAKTLVNKFLNTPEDRLKGVTPAGIN